MVLALIVGDLHFKRESPQLSDLVIQKIMIEIERCKPEIVVLLGDILDTHDNMHMHTFNRAVRFIKSIAAKQINVFVIMGNHDRPDGTTFLTEESAFYALKGFPFIYIVDRVMDIGWEIEGVKEPLRFIFVPYVPTGTFHEALDTLEVKITEGVRPACIFAHGEFRGAKIGDAQSKFGDEWKSENPLIITGHLHTAQKVGNNVIYPGTPNQQSSGDLSDKGILAVDFFPGKPPVFNAIKLAIRKKKVVKLKPEMVDSFVPDQDFDIHVDIVGTPTEIKALGDSGAVPKMRSKGVSVSLSIERTPNPANPDNKPLKELIRSMISNDADAIKVYEDIFGQRNLNVGQQQVTLSQASLDELLKAVNSINAQPLNMGADLQSILKHTERAPTTPVLVPQTPMTLRAIQPEPTLFTIPSQTPVVDSKAVQEPKLNVNELTTSLMASADVEKSGLKPLDIFLNQALSGTPFNNK